MDGKPLAPWWIKRAIPWITWGTAGYICYHRRKLLPAAQPIPTQLQAALRAFFPVAVLSNTRVVRANLPEPKLYPLLKWLGISGVLEMSSIGAITLIDLVAYPERLDRNMLVHELIHVVQYRVLGLRLFSEKYVRGWVERGGYEAIPLERQAYELEGRIRSNPKPEFSVEEDVIWRLKTGRL